MRYPLSNKISIKLVSESTFPFDIFVLFVFVFVVVFVVIGAGLCCVMY